LTILQGVIGVVLPVANMMDYKLLAFVLRVFIGGRGSGLCQLAWIHLTRYPQPDGAVTVLCLIILGGLNLQYEVIIGVLALIALPDLLRGLSDFRMLSISVLLVVQNTHTSLEVASRGYVIQTGVIMLADDADKLKANEVVRKTYLGIA
jgi:hypothetical protein